MNCLYKLNNVILKGGILMFPLKCRIIKVNDNMCRITISDCRSIYRNISEGACICSMDVMLDQIEHITNEIKKLGGRAVFVYD
jgi:hypothetical protein